MQMKGLELRNQEVQLDTSTTGCNGKMKSHITIVKWDIKMMMKRQEEEEQEEEWERGGWQNDVQWREKVANIKPQIVVLIYRCAAPWIR